MGLCEEVGEAVERKVDHWAEGGLRKSRVGVRRGEAVADAESESGAMALWMEQYLDSEDHAHKTGCK